MKNGRIRNKILSSTCRINTGINGPSLPVSSREGMLFFYQRSDNCIKNHFYSKLRKGLRKVNKKIHKYMKKEYKDIKTATLYRVIETMENRNKGNNI